MVEWVMHHREQPVCRVLLCSTDMVARLTEDTLRREWPNQPRPAAPCTRHDTREATFPGAHAATACRQKACVDRLS
jgi:hypothetical protein